MQIVRASSLVLKKRYETDHIIPLKMIVFIRGLAVFEVSLTFTNNEKLRMSLRNASF